MRQLNLFVFHCDYGRLRPYSTDLLGPVFYCIRLLVNHLKHRSSSLLSLCTFIYS
nr:MAG TPA: hypothetical protein [Caudoviricetes sp.]